MKQNLQPPATPLEMLSLFFPAGLLDYFDLVNHVSQETYFIFFLEEKPSIPQEHSHLHLHSKGFFPETGQTYSRDWNLLASGTRITAEFGAFLKALLRQSCG